MTRLPSDEITAETTAESLSWSGIVRLGLVQTALGAIVVLTTTTINRVMVVELALPALLPGLLVGLHYAVQITRPRMGHGSDVGGRRTPWIVGGMAVLACGGSLAAVATLVTAATPWLGIPLAVLAFVLVGLGVGCAGTSLLVLLAKLVAPRYRGAAATTLWVMMIVGFIVTSVVAGKQLDPFSLERLVQVTGAVSAIAFAVTVLAVFRIEPRTVRAGARSADAVPAGDLAGESAVDAAGPAGDDAPVPSYRESFAAVRAEPEARRFGTFVFVSMLAYSAQDLILEPFAGSVFGMTPGESTALGGSQNGGVLAGMLCVAFCTSLLRERFLGGALGSLRNWAVGGCIASAVALVTLALGGQSAASFPLRPAVFALGFANGAFAVAAIGSMMDLVGRGGARREGVRMGFWGAAQALAFGLGGIAATGAVDLARQVLASEASAYGLVFALQAVLFLVAAKLAIGIYRPAGAEARPATFPAGRIALETDR